MAGQLQTAATSSALARALPWAWLGGGKRPTQARGQALPPRSKGVGSYDYLIQIRRLRMAPIGVHEDVCVDSTCYTTGPSEGIYRRDSASSAWALTNADGWSTPSGWLFNVTAHERDQMQAYMDSLVTGRVGRAGFLANLWEYYANGFCITFSREQFNYMVNLVSDRRVG